MHIYVFVYVLIECSSEMVNHGIKLPFNHNTFPTSVLLEWPPLPVSLSQVYRWPPHLPLELCFQYKVLLRRWREDGNGLLCRYIILFTAKLVAEKTHPTSCLLLITYYAARRCGSWPRLLTLLGACARACACVCIGCATHLIVELND